MKNADEPRLDLAALLLLHSALSPLLRLASLPLLPLHSAPSPLLRLASLPLLRLAPLLLGPPLLRLAPSSLLRLAPSPLGLPLRPMPSPLLRPLPDSLRQPGRFCGQVRVSSAFSLLAATSFSASVYTRHAAKRAAAVTSPPTKKKKPHSSRRPPPRTPSPERGESPSPPAGSPKKPVTDPAAVLVCPEHPGPHTDRRGEGGVFVVVTPPPPRPYVGCPRLTIPCSCENPELCSAFF
uniref:Uncharacterized protein n=1 Tax=Oryza glumipatula TaxID=40148 RepID=A0A0E0BTN3_9ORYZ